MTNEPLNTPLMEDFVFTTFYNAIKEYVSLTFGRPFYEIRYQKAVLSIHVTKLHRFISNWSPQRVLGERSYPLIWEQFDPIRLDEMARVLNAVSATTCQLDPCPSWLIKASRMVTARWVWAVVNTSLLEGIFLGPFKEALVCPLLNITISWSHLSGEVPSSLPCSLFKEEGRRSGCRAASEGPGWNILYRPPSSQVLAHLWDRHSIGHTCG